MTDFDFKTRRYLVLGKTGKTGRRVEQLLAARGAWVTGLSRKTIPAFDWGDQTVNWQKIFTGFDAIYVTYQPDLAVPQAEADIARLTVAARQAGVKHIVLLSGRGEPGARKAELILADSGLNCHVIRASWFNQNFTEGFIAEMVQHGVVALPRGDVPEPFIDANDIAEAAVSCLLEPEIPAGVYEVTGPELLTFKQCVTLLSEHLEKPIQFIDISVDDFVKQLARLGFDENMLWLMQSLFSEVLDGRNSQTTDSLSMLLQRQPTSFNNFLVKELGGMPNLIKSPEITK